MMEEAQETQKKAMFNRTTEEDAKPVYIECRVPRGVLIGGKDDEPGRVLNIVQLREMSGHEEDLLVTETIDITTRLNRIIGNCIVSVSDGEYTIDDRTSINRMMTTHPDGFTLSDAMVLMFKLREVTVGDEFRQTITCPKCTDEEGVPYSWTHVGSFSDIEVQPCKGDVSEPVRNFVTSRGNVIEWEMMTAAKDAEYSRKKMIKNKATRALMMRVSKINDHKATVERLQDLPMTERTEIKKQFDQEGGMDMDIAFVCRNCEHEFTVPINIGAKGFFRHLED